VKDGVVLAVEKLVTSKLLLPGANRRIQTVDRHMGIVPSTAHTLSNVGYRGTRSWWSTTHSYKSSSRRWLSQKLPQSNPDEGTPLQWAV